MRCGDEMVRCPEDIYEGSVGLGNCGLRGRKWATNDINVMVGCLLLFRVVHSH